MKAYLEQIGGEWLDDFVYMSKEPLKALGFEIRAFDGDDMEDTLLCYPLNIEKDVIVGSVESTSQFFKACGIEVPNYLGYPHELERYLDRELELTEIDGLKNVDFPYFIKPSEGVKMFTGEVIESQKQLDNLKEYYNVNDETGIWYSGLVNFISEFRCFVHEGELKGIQFYQGDFKVFPDVSVIEEMVKTYTSANCAYTLDVGVTDDGKTLLVEVNDMWAIGSYGMDAKTYVLMCVRRMREIGRQFHGETESLWKRLKNRYNE
tara:strand:- start:21195 stop:21983 length:789 start_codon:yes stop_codon:yes gene_type:complete